jgi:hypothetical protein
MKPYASSQYEGRLEAIWNHITRYRGGSVKRLVARRLRRPTFQYKLVYFGMSSASIAALPVSIPAKVTYCYSTLTSA